MNKSSIAQKKNIQLFEHKLLTGRKQCGNILLVQMIEQKGGVQMPFDYRKLRGRIIEKYGSQTGFAKAMGWSERTLSLKITGNRPWKQPDICKAIELLELTEEDIPLYVFTPKVQNFEHH